MKYRMKFVIETDGRLTLLARVEGPYERTCHNLLWDLMKDTRENHSAMNRFILDVIWDD